MAALALLLLLALATSPDVTRADSTPRHLLSTGPLEERHKKNNDRISALETLVQQQAARTQGLEAELRQQGNQARADRERAWHSWLLEPLYFLPVGPKEERHRRSCADDRISAMETLVQQQASITRGMEAELRQQEQRHKRSSVEVRISALETVVQQQVARTQGLEAELRQQGNQASADRERVWHSWLLEPLYFLPAGPLEQRQRRSSADDLISALESLVQQQAARTQGLEAELRQQGSQASGDSDKLALLLQSMRADLSSLAFTVSDMQAQASTTAAASLAVTPPPVKAVAFTVQFAADDRTNGVPLARRTALLFDQVVTNLGDGYDPTSGLFTAPVDGVYAVGLTVTSTSGHGPVHFHVRKERSIVLASVSAGAGATHAEDQGSSLVTTYLHRGQSVCVHLQSGDAVRGSSLTAFTGFLLQAD